MSVKLLDAVKKLVRDSRMLSPAILALIEVGLEKILEIEFSCPCVPKLNAGYSVCVFFIPALVVLFLMLSQKWTGIKDCYKRFLIALVPTVAWLVITFLDGRYFVCLKAYGTGTFNVSLHTEGVAQSCNMKDEAMTEKETLDIIKEYTATSQVIGAGISGLFALIWMISGCFGYLPRPAEDDIENGSTENPEESQELSQMT